MGCSSAPAYASGHNEALQRGLRGGVRRNGLRAEAGPCDYSDQQQDTERMTAPVGFRSAQGTLYRRPQARHS